LVQLAGVALTAALVVATMAPAAAQGELAAPRTGPASGMRAATPAPDPGEVSWALAPAEGQLGAGRATFAYNADPGSVINDAMVITNLSLVPIELRIYGADAFTTPDGQFDLAPAKDQAKDVGAWLSFGTESTGSGLVRIEAGQEAKVDFTLAVPAEARPGDHAGGLVTSLVEATTDATIGVDRRLALRAYVTVSGELEPGLKLTDLRLVSHTSANPLSGGRVTVSYTLANTGNARLVANEVVTVSGPFGWASRQVEQNLEEILPGGEVKRQAEVSGVLPLVRTSAEVTVNGLAVGLGAEGQPAAASGTVKGWSVPWVWLAVVLLAVGGAVFLARRQALRSVGAAANDGPKPGGDLGDSDGSGNAETA